MDKEEIISEIKKQIKEKIRPIIVMDGGNIEFVDYDNDTGLVKVKLSGACHGCPMASFTLKNAVFEVLREYIPEVTEVVAIEYDSKEDNEELSFDK